MGSLQQVLRVSIQAPPSARRDEGTTLTLREVPWPEITSSMHVGHGRSLRRTQSPTSLNWDALCDQLTMLHRLTMQERIPESVFSVGLLHAELNLENLTFTPDQPSESAG